MFAVKKCAGNNNPYNAAAWTDTYAGQTGQGQCIVNNGFTGTATAACSVDGVWGAVITACTEIAFPCPQVVGYQGTTGYTSWPSTVAGADATGTCFTGYVFSNNTAPTRTCFTNSSWSTTVNNDCILGTRINAGHAPSCCSVALA